MKDVWHHVINRACDNNHIVLAPALKHYLLMTITHYQAAENLHDELLGGNLLKASTLPSMKKKALLRETGDRCLIMAGFFPNKHKAMHVSRGYFVQVGKTAYRYIAYDRNMKKLDSELYEQLDQNFLTLVYIIRQFNKLH